MVATDPIMYWLGIFSIVEFSTVENRSNHVLVRVWSVSAIKKQSCIRWDLHLVHDIGAHGVNGIANFRVKPNGDEYNMTIEMYDKNSELTMLKS